MSSTRDELEAKYYVENDPELSKVVKDINESKTRDEMLQSIEAYKKSVIAKQDELERIREACSRVFGISLDKVEHKRLKSGIDIIAFYDAKLGRKRIIDYSYAKSLINEFTNIQNSDKDFQTEDDAMNAEAIAKKEADSNLKRELDLIDIERAKNEYTELIKRVPNQDPKKISSILKILAEAGKRNIKYINFENMVALDDKGNIIESYYNEKTNEVVMESPEDYDSFVAYRDEESPAPLEENPDTLEQEQKEEEEIKDNEDELKVYKQNPSQPVINRTQTSTTPNLETYIPNTSGVVVAAPNSAKGHLQRAVDAEGALNNMFKEKTVAAIDAKGKIALAQKIETARAALQRIASSLMSTLELRGDSESQLAASKLRGIVAGLDSEKGGIELYTIYDRIIDALTGTDLLNKSLDSQLMGYQDQIKNCLVMLERNFGEVDPKTFTSKDMSEKTDFYKIESENADAELKIIEDNATEDTKAAINILKSIGKSLYEQPADFSSLDRDGKTLEEYMDEKYAENNIGNEITPNVVLDPNQVEVDPIDFELKEQVVTPEELDLENEMKVCSINKDKDELYKRIQEYAKNMAQLDDDFEKQRISKEEFDFYELMSKRYIEKLQLKKVRVKTLEYDPNKEGGSVALMVVAAITIIVSIIVLIVMHK